MSEKETLTINGQPLSFQPGQTLLEVARAHDLAVIEKSSDTVTVGASGKLRWDTCPRSARAGCRQATPPLVSRNGATTPR